jgi:hypothetical protein
MKEPVIVRCHHDTTKVFMRALLETPTPTSSVNEVVADEQGLRWRSGRSEQQVRWDEVTDYYEQRDRFRWIVIETTKGKLRLHEDTWTNLPALRQLVQAKATNAKATDWGVYGSRPCDLPHEFRYDKAKALDGFLVSAIVFVLCAFLVAVVVGKLHSPPMFALTAVAVALATAIVLPFGLFSALDTYRRLSHLILVRPDGITFTDGQRMLEARWEEVTDYYLVRWLGILHRCVVVTKQGSFDFTPTVRDYWALRHAIERFATQAAAKGWQRRR